MCDFPLSMLLTFLWNKQSKDFSFTFDKWRNRRTDIGQPRSHNGMPRQDPCIPWPRSIYMVLHCCQMNMVIKAELKHYLEVQSAPCGPLIDGSFQRASTNPDVIYTRVWYGIKFPQYQLRDLQSCYFHLLVYFLLWGALAVRKSCIIMILKST